MPRPFPLLVAALLAIALVGAGCGDDDSDTASTPETPAAVETTPEAAPEEAPADTAVTIDEATLREFIDAVNEDPAVLCDPDNISADLLAQIGDEEACRAAAAEEEPGGDYTIDDITIADDGTTAEATITDDDGTTTVGFIVEGDQIKVASSE